MSLYQFNRRKKTVTQGTYRLLALLHKINNVLTCALAMEAMNVLCLWIFTILYAELLVQCLSVAYRNDTNSISREAY